MPWIWNEWLKQAILKITTLTKNQVLGVEDDSSRCMPLRRSHISLQCLIKTRWWTTPKQLASSPKSLKRRNDLPGLRFQMAFQKNRGANSSTLSSCASYWLRRKTRIRLAGLHQRKNRRTTGAISTITSTMIVRMVLFLQTKWTSFKMTRPSSSWKGKIEMILLPPTTITVTSITWLERDNLSYLKINSEGRARWKRKRRKRSRKNTGF